MENKSIKIQPEDAQIIADPSNDYLSILVGADAKFNSGATGVIIGQSYNISFAWPSSPGTSFTTIRIDGIDYIYGIGGTMVQSPTELPDLKNESIWLYYDKAL